ncbi:sugar phosphate isomerase/epimerase family protein [Muriicola sp. Z0-33]|uniref:sugar phosphate isomerase/epimerase family protein n=1 Tax=Muriicola sp. Z0-33 TaxID=2816957 RepID=UPI0022373469|nr:sugar phosphate isomerase/epimerase family protein [Muriicola sp. Z0-33]MCW5515797.1 sugar phosphate isomerase/epimerase [Muriicola sp. Z0-33]
MTDNKISRRKALENTLKGSMAALAGFGFSSDIPRVLPDNVKKVKPQLPMRVSLNTSTLLHYNIPVDQQIDMVANAGFDGVELWMRNIKSFLDSGGSTEQLKEKLQSHNLLLENIIGFSKWCSDDAEERKAALDLLAEEMEITAGLGGAFIAAPVQGIAALDRTKYDDYAERFTAILELGDQTGVTPVLELWGMGALNKVADCAQIVIASGHPKATMLLDFYHIHRGGNDWDTLDCLNGKRLPVIHMNDYPEHPSWDKLTDADRVLPGEGVCPFNEILPKLFDAGFRGGLSVELFNKGYWDTMDAETLLKKSYTTTQQVIQKSLAGKI